MANKHSAAQLSEGLEHVVYEIWKHRQSVADYTRIAKVGSDAALEFRILHHRGLLEFFYGLGTHDDNLSAWEYVDDWPRYPDRKKVPLRHYIKRCHAMLAHISVERTEIAKRGQKRWTQEWRTIEPRLDQLVNDFLTSLSDEHKAVCLRWVDRWSTFPAGNLLAGLAPALGRDTRIKRMSSSATE